MPFEKGNTFGKGRPPGTTSKLLQDADIKHLEKTISLLLQGAEDDIKKLSPNQRISALLKFLEFRLPKMRSVEGGLIISNNDEQMQDAIAAKIFKKAIQDGTIIKYDAK